MIIVKKKLKLKFKPTPKNLNYYKPTLPELLYYIIGMK